MVSGSFNYLLKVQKEQGTSYGLLDICLDRLTEDYGYYIEYHPKPIKGDWNGSGMHANFSNSLLRSAALKRLMRRFAKLFVQ